MYERYNGTNYKNLLFDILIDHNEYFGQDIKFEEKYIQKEFVEYSIKKGKYTRTFNYLKHKIIQLNLLKEYADEIFNLKNDVQFEKLEDDSYKDAQQVVQDLIQFQKVKGRKFISFPKTFWENYFNYYKLNTGPENKIQKTIIIFLFKFFIYNRFFMILIQFFFCLIIILYTYEYNYI